MKQVLFIQGAGSDGAHREDAALAESLREALGAGFNVRYPKMPNEAEPKYEEWKRVILEDVRDMGAGAIVVGHSIGASVLAKVFTEPGAKPAIAGAFLVSGPFWHDDEFWHWDEATLSADASAQFPRDAALFLYHGADDEFVPVAHLDMYAKALPQAVVRRLSGRDHQLNNDLRDVARDIAGLD